MRILDRSPATVLSLRMVAKEAGVAAPSIYAHFTDASHLASEIVRECWRQMGEEMAQAALTVAETDVLGSLQMQLRAYVLYAMERPSRYQLLFAMQPIDTHESHALPGLVQPAFRRIRDGLRTLRDGGQIPVETGTFALALHIISLVHGRIALAHLAPWRPGNDADGITDFVFGALDRLLPRKRGP
ncbi:MAG: hypothetical protein RLZZ136_1773 [Pseudomonadota bacterium]